MALFEIKHRFSGKVLFSGEFGSLKLCVEAAVEAGADLAGADLADAKNVGDFTMSDGMKFSEYLRDVVPALLTAGGKTLEEVVGSGAWECHEWSNCPMAAAFGIDSPEKGPPLLRGRIKEFVQFYDSGLIPNPLAKAEQPEQAT